MHYSSDFCIYLLNNEQRARLSICARPTALVQLDTKTVFTPWSFQIRPGRQLTVLKSVSARLQLLRLSGALT